MLHVPMVSCPLGFIVSVSLDCVWSLTRATLKHFCFWHIFEKKNKKTFQKLKQFYFRIENV